MVKDNKCKFDIFFKIAESFFEKIPLNTIKVENGSLKAEAATINS